MKPKVAGSLKRPQREGLPSFKIGILVKNKIKTTVVARTDERFVFAKNKGIERASIFPASNSNGYAVLVALRLDSNNFCRNGFHWALSISDFAADGPVFKASGTERHQRRRERMVNSHRLPMKSSFFARRSERWEQRGILLYKQILLLIETRGVPGWMAASAIQACGPCQL
jgi:hypothetical protein